MLALPPLPFPLCNGYFTCHSLACCGQCSSCLFSHLMQAFNQHTKSHLPSMMGNDVRGRLI